MRRTVVVLLAGSAALLAPSAPARAATFPGLNGLIAYERFSSSDPGSQVWTVSLGGTQVDLSGTVYGDDEPQFSPDGTTVLFRHGDQLMTMAADGSHRTVVPGTPTSGSNENPAWAPTGTAIVFTNNDQIMTINLDGTDLTTVTSGSDDLDPDWSPDGSTIAFTSYRTAATAHVFTVRPDGTAITDVSQASGIPAGDSDTEPSWTPDGTHLLVATTYTSGGLQSAEMNRDGSSRTALTSGFPGSDSPTASPDGADLAYTANDNGTIEVFVQSSTGTAVISSTTDNSIGDHLSWQQVPAPRPPHLVHQGRSGTPVAHPRPGTPRTVRPRPDALAAAAR